MASDGFTIECKDGERYRVTDEQAPLVSERSEYFRSVFEHPLVESHARVLTKPDWSVETARQIIMLLTKGKIIIPDYSRCGSFGQAADHIVLGCTIAAPWDSTQWLDAELTRTIFRHLHESEELFLLETVLDAFTWKELLSRGILLRYADPEKRIGTNLVVKLESLVQDEHAQENEEGDNSDAESDERNPPMKRKYSVSSKMGFTATVEGLCASLHAFRVQELDDDSFVVENNEQFSMAVEATGRYDIPFPTTEESIFEREYFVEFARDRIAVYEGDLNAIKMAWLTYVEKRVETVVLRIASPSSKTLEQLREASVYCLDNPSTLGFDPATNVFIAIKTYRDMLAMLTYLVRDNDRRSLLFVEMKGVSGIF